jgi:butyryl-CoA dehydrogenase
VNLPQAEHGTRRAYFESRADAGAGHELRESAACSCRASSVMAANSFFSKAGIGIAAAAMRPRQRQPADGDGTPLQQDAFATERSSAGRWSRHHVASRSRKRWSSLSDIATLRSVPDGAGFARATALVRRYRLFAADATRCGSATAKHELTENIVHLVPRRSPGPDGKLDPGTRGISLFIVAEEARRPDGELDRRSATTSRSHGLNHKLGYRGIPNTLAQLRRGKFPARWRERVIATVGEAAARLCAACST